jgi:hypothetical protein
MRRVGGIRRHHLFALCDRAAVAARGHTPQMPQGHERARARGHDVEGYRPIKAPSERRTARRTSKPLFSICCAIRPVRRTPRRAPTQSSIDAGTRLVDVATSRPSGYAAAAKEGPTLTDLDTWIWPVLLAPMIGSFVWVLVTPWHACLAGRRATHAGLCLVSVPKLLESTESLVPHGRRPDSLRTADVDEQKSSEIQSRSPKIPERCHGRGVGACRAADTEGKTRRAQA